MEIISVYHLPYSPSLVWPHTGEGWGGGCTKNGGQLVSRELRGLAELAWKERDLLDDRDGQDDETGVPVTLASVVVRVPHIRPAFEVDPARVEHVYLEHGADRDLGGLGEVEAELLIPTRGHEDLVHVGVGRWGVWGVVPLVEDLSIGSVRVAVCTLEAVDLAAASRVDQAHFFLAVVHARHPVGDLIARHDDEHPVEEAGTAVVGGGREREVDGVSLADLDFGGSVEPVGHVGDRGLIVVEAFRDLEGTGVLFVVGRFDLLDVIGAGVGLGGGFADVFHFAVAGGLHFAVAIGGGGVVVAAGEEEAEGDQGIAHVVLRAVLVLFGPVVWTVVGLKPSLLTMINMTSKEGWSSRGARPGRRVKELEAAEDCGNVGEEFEVNLADD